jgi:hypothetical protein
MSLCSFQSDATCNPRHCMVIGLICMVIGLIDEVAHRYAAECTSEVRR